jgi:hypothetical protein
MAYRSDKRIITIHIHKDNGAYWGRVVPHHQVAFVGDTVVWHVQGNTPDGVVISVGNFRPIDAAPGIVFSGGKSKLRKPPTIPASRIKRVAAGQSVVVPKVPDGTYKYDVLWDDVVWIDPELETKGRP